MEAGRKGTPSAAGVRAGGLSRTPHARLPGPVRGGTDTPLSFVVFMEAEAQLGCHVGSGDHRAPQSTGSGWG